IQIESSELDPIGGRLDHLVASLDPRARGAGAGPAEARPSVEAVVSQMKTIGDQLVVFLLPPHVQADLRPGGLFLEIGMDEALLPYPWELMHDGEDFL